MIELTVYNYLKRVLGVPVYMEMPERRTESSFVLVERTAGGEKNFIRSAVVAVQAYAPSLYQAAALDDAVVKAMKSLANELTICKVSLNSDYNFTATDTKDYRYQAVFDIYYTED